MLRRFPKWTSIHCSFNYYTYFEFAILLRIVWMRFCSSDGACFWLKVDVIIVILTFETIIKHKVRRARCRNELTLSLRPDLQPID